MSRKSILFLIIVLYFFAGTLSVFSQLRVTNDKVVVGTTHTIHSEILNENRPYLVYLPPGYETSLNKYSVMYLLDGREHFLHTSGIVEFLSRLGVMPQMIIVAIPNTKDRTHDLTPPLSDSSANFPTAGGADKFLSFIGDELMPLINKTYRTIPYNILAGHSFGGLFVVNALVKRADLFNSYISISPSLWWDNGSYVKSTEKYLEENPSVKKSIYFTVGAEEPQRMHAPLEQLVDFLKKNAPENFKWDYKNLPNDDHGLTPHESIFYGLRFIFSDWRLPADLTSLGLKGMQERFRKLSEELNVKLDVPERDINILGYQLLNQKKVKEAIDVFKYNVEKFPGSANVYDSLGDGLEADGQLVLARQNCETAVKKGAETNDPNLNLYKDHLEKLNKKIHEGE